MCEKATFHPYTKEKGKGKRVTDPFVRQPLSQRNCDRAQWIPSLKTQLRAALQRSRKDKQKRGEGTCGKNPSIFRGSGVDIKYILLRHVQKETTLD